MLNINIINENELLFYHSNNSFSVLSGKSYFISTCPCMSFAKIIAVTLMYQARFFKKILCITGDWIHTTLTQMTFNCTCIEYINYV